MLYLFGVSQSKANLPVVFPVSWTSGTRGGARDCLPPSAASSSSVRSRKQTVLSDRRPAANDPIAFEPLAPRMRLLLMAVVVPVLTQVKVPVVPLVSGPGDGAVPGRGAAAGRGGIQGPPGEYILPNSTRAEPQTPVPHTRGERERERERETERDRERDREREDDRQKAGGTDRETHTPVPVPVTVPVPVAVVVSVSVPVPVLVAVPVVVVPVPVAMVLHVLKRNQALLGFCS